MGAAAGLATFFDALAIFLEDTTTAFLGAAAFFFAGAAFFTGLPAFLAATFALGAISVREILKNGWATIGVWLGRR